MNTPTQLFHADRASEEPAQVLPAPPPPPRRGGLGRGWAIVGIVVGFLFLIVPGVLALRSYRRWRSGVVRRPTFAWACAWIGVPLLALTIYSTWALYNMPLVQDDFSDTASGWPVDEGPDPSFGYEGGGYRIEAQGVDPRGVYLVWGEGALPNVAVEADVLISSEQAVEAGAGVGCLEREGAGYVFLVGFDGNYAIGRFEEAGEVLATGEIPAKALAGGSSIRIRGECRSGFGETELAMYVNGTKVAEATDRDEEGYHAFTAIRLMAVTVSDDPVDVLFDNAYVIGIQPS